jgi:DNA-binding NtrC family response regulator
MPLATPTAIDGWPTNQKTCHSPASAIDRAVEETPTYNNSRTPTLIGQSPVMKKLFSVIERVAPTDASVLITGATGTGKELAARAIHDLSPRRDNAFVDINCSAIPETLIEAELFGHQRGTFTGAHENRSGLFEKASRGTLFLDEVDALNLSAQAKLLRVLQERTVRRIGARANIAIDVRIISASNCDLAQAVAEGRFRPDLYYRLRVLPLQLPELCTRGDDVDLLVDHFLRLKSERMGQQQVRHFTPEAMRALREYPWPGNVRELENAIEYALAIGMDNELGMADLPMEIANHIPSDLHDFRSVLQAYMNDTVPLAEIEKRYILTVLQQFGGNQVRAAAALGIDRSKLYRRLRQYGVKAVKFFQEEEEHGLQFRGAKSTTTTH